jgi:hypothetical protein
MIAAITVFVLMLKLFGRLLTVQSLAVSKAPGACNYIDTGGRKIILLAAYRAGLYDSGRAYRVKFCFDDDRVGCAEGLPVEDFFTTEHGYYDFMNLILGR